MTTPVKAVVDTNVLVSGLLTADAPPCQIIDAWLGGRFTLVTSLLQVEELKHVLTYPRIAAIMRLLPADLALILAALLAQSAVVPGRLRLPGVTRDPKDDHLVACAVEGEARYIVSGGQDLLVLRDYQGIQVVMPHDFAASVLSAIG